MSAETLYYQLLMEVHTKYPGETRHQTAMRYIREWEKARAGAGRVIHPASSGPDEQFEFYEPAWAAESREKDEKLWKETYDAALAERTEEPR